MHWLYACSVTAERAEYGHETALVPEALSSSLEPRCRTLKTGFHRTRRFVRKIKLLEMEFGMSHFHHAVHSPKGRLLGMQHLCCSSPGQGNPVPFHTWAICGGKFCEQLQQPAAKTLLLYAIVEMVQLRSWPWHQELCRGNTRASIPSNQPPVRDSGTCLSRTLTLPRQQSTSLAGCSSL